MFGECELDTLRPSIAANAVLLVVAGVAIVLYGFVRNRGAPSVGFFYLIAFYPVWGLVQQLLLCPLLYSNLEKVSGSRAASMLIGAALFGLVHVPDWILALLTAAAAMIWITLYRRWPNLWVQAFSHGWLGALAYYYGLGRDPWAELMKSLGY